MGKNNKRIVVLIALIFGAFCHIKAQTGMGFFESDAFFIAENDSLDFPTIGGMDNPQFSEIDLDGDGVLDLFVFDRKTDLIKTFRYNTSLAKYEYAPSFERLFPEDIIDFALLKDLNCDGFNDIFTFYQGGFKVYYNDGTFPISFSVGIEKIQTSYGGFETSAFVLSGDIPAIVDVDNDGDLDILTFGTVSSENTIEWQQNIAMDSFGICDSVKFVANTRCWGNVQEQLNSATLETVSCRGISPPEDTAGRGQRHAGSSVLLLDLDNDGDQDLITGDIGTRQMIRAYNVGDSASASIDVTTQTTAFPNANFPADLAYQVSGYEIDVDHDGFNDLIIAPNNYIDSSFNDKQAWYYRNTDTTGAYNFGLANQTFLTDQMLDLGSATHPQLIDVNGDGLQDLIIGVDFRKSKNTNHQARLYAFTQSQSGGFHLVDDDYAGLSNYQLNSAALAFADLDGDGDLDLLIGNSDGAMHYFKNTSSNLIPNFSLNQAEFMDIQSIGGYAAPTFGDVNNDGLLDLIVGERIGTLSYFQNIGTTNSPLYNSEPTISNFGNIDISPSCCLGHAKPLFIEDSEIYGEGKFLFVGSDEQDIEVYKIASNLNGTFPLVDRIHINAGNLAPLLADFDDDGIIELLAGTAEGGLKYLDRAGNYPVSVQEISEQTSYKLYPNPTKGGITIEYQGENPVDYKIIDLSGIMLQAGSIVPGTNQLNLDYLSEGIYFFFPENNSVVRFVKQ